jgi:hypothetical protein
MALSNSVEESLNEAQSQLKNALAFAARQEESYVMVAISRMINDIELIRKTDKAQDQIQEILKKIDPNIQF